MLSFPWSADLDAVQADGRELDHSHPSQWKDEDYTTGLKHDMIFFSINKESDMLVENPLYAYQYNFEKADWKKINEEILSK